jgi:hypothetical protein
MIEASNEPVLDYSAAYYDPPRVKWWVLLIVSTVASVVVSALASENYRAFATGLLFDAWGVYFCIWLRRIEPRSKSLTWYLSSMAAGFLSFLLSVTVGQVGGFETVIDSLGFADLVLGIIAIFVIRAELVRHYNQQEGFGLVLGPVMTLFFSFVYFQYHLFDIAEQRHKERTSLTV